MTKFQLMLTSLVAVIPGAFLAYVLIMAVLQFSLSTMAYGLVGTTLLATGIVVLIPAGIVIGGGRSSTPAKSAAANKAESDPLPVDDEVEAEEDSGDPMDSTGGAELEIGTSEFDLGNSFEDIDQAGDESDVETEPVEEFESIEIDQEDMDEVNLNFDEEDEPKPKKKKK